MSSLRICLNTNLTWYIQTKTYHRFWGNRLGAERVENYPRCLVAASLASSPCPPQTATRKSPHAPPVDHWTMQMPERKQRAKSKQAIFRFLQNPCKSFIKLHDEIHSCTSCNGEKNCALLLDIVNCFNEVRKKVRNCLAYTCNKSYIHVKAKQRKFILQHDSGIKVLTSNIVKEYEINNLSLLTLFLKIKVVL